MLDSRIFAFGILSDQDSIDVIIWGFIASYGFTRAYVGEEVECAAKGQVKGNMTFSYRSLLGF